MKRTITLKDMVSNLPREGKFICSDGEVPFVWELVRQRGAFKDLSNNKSTDKVISAEGKTRLVMQFIVDWILESKTTPLRGTRLMLDIYDAAVEYRIEDLCENIKDYLEKTAMSKIGDAVILYKCIKQPTLMEVKDAAYRTIRFTIRNGMYVLHCDKVPDEYLHTFMCASCLTERQALKTFFDENELCACGVSLAVSIQKHSHLGVNCDGKRTIMRSVIPSINILSAEEKVELFDRICNDKN